MKTFILITEASQVVLVVKNLPANAADMKDVGLISGWGRSPGGRRGYPLQSSCLENPMDRGAWRATVHRVSESQTRLSTQQQQERERNGLKGNKDIIKPDGTHVQTNDTESLRCD